MVQLCKEAGDSGALHVLVLAPVPWPLKITPESAITSYQEIADKSPIPIIIYNFPTLTNGLNPDSDVIEELAKHPNIIGIKLACMKWDRRISFQNSTSSCTICLKKPGSDSLATQGVQQKENQSLIDASNDGPEGEKNLHEGNESELEVGLCFDEEELSKWHKDQLDKQEEESKAQKTTYPKPKMLSHDTAVAMRKRKAPDEIPDKQSALKSSEHKKGTALAAKRSRRKFKHDTDPTL
ncbi:hypothetical protein EDD18DRAFT_1377261 [Armillaria luteobubalina]|uniref:Dihydrodipicolinate synthase n=1 Tax=Armillaria luteobubalina TaxID=153913 RepID=A0AA39QCM4_9AGAR|nr:hypothetical protein EDD18DRAFT_1377261 [Armillaria luteobubalina]